MCEAIDQMRNQIKEAKLEAASANRRASEAKREAAEANRRVSEANRRAAELKREALAMADAYKSYLRKLGVSEEEIRAIGSGVYL